MASHTVDYIPASDEGFNAWVINLLRYISFHSAGWGMPADAFTAAQAMLDPWKAALANAKNPETRTKATVNIKTELRKAFIAEIRRVVKAYITYNPAVTDADRDNMALPVHDKKPTPVPAPADAPIVEVDFSRRQQHAVIVKNPAGRAKPANAHGFELWSKVGTPPPATDKDFRYAGFSTKSPFILPYEMEDVGKTVYYRAHWVNVKNEPGPWSETVTATVP